MIPAETIERLRNRFGEAITSAVTDGLHPHAAVRAEKWHDCAKVLRDELGFNFLRCISALDLGEGKLAMVYDLVAIGAILNHTLPDGRVSDLSQCKCEFAVRVEVDRANPHVPSVADVWPAADWHEREAYDMMGIVFDGHPDTVVDADGTHPRRILCPDDWAGYPLRKDYEYPKEYHGIPCMVETGSSINQNDRI